MEEKKAQGLELAQQPVDGNGILLRPAYALTSEEILLQLGSDEASGLSDEEVTSRQAKYGPNDLGKEKGVQPLQILIAQVVNAMTMVCFHTI